MTKDLRNLIDRLLEKNPNKRLGFFGPQEVKQHSFFAKIIWENVVNKTINAPFVPKVKNDLDISHIDPEFTQMDPSSYNTDKNSLEPSAGNKYEGIFVLIFFLFVD